MTDFVMPVKFCDYELIILDQTKLPQEEIYEKIGSKEQLWDAIKKLKVRGAPAIGVAAALGLYAVTKDSEAENREEYLQVLRETGEYLKSSRPTAVNLAWAVDRINNFASRCEETDPVRLKEAVLSEALRIQQEDIDSCLAMGEYGLSLLKPGMGILTHCNAGTLATAKYGTCLSAVYLGEQRGYGFRVFADETRPLLQGARLTSWELNKMGVDVTLICDNMAATVMKKGLVDAVVVGCDRMAANGDGANKIGTAGVAILAKEYGIPFYMYVPASTIDLNTPTGDDIVIEERDGDEIYRMWYEKPMAPEGIKTFNPAFDVTDHRYITAVITDRGIARPPYDVSLRKLMEVK